MADDNASTIEIPLNHGRIAVIDSTDVNLVAGYKWRWEKSAMQSGYAVTNKPMGRKGHKKGIRRPRCRVMMHNLIMPPPEGFEVDHRDGDGLNNRRLNLRLATRSQQCMNRRAVRGASSQYKGVRWWTKGKKWSARIKISGRSIHLGYFRSERDAAIAYNSAALKHFGEYARVNDIEAVK